MLASLALLKVAIIPFAAGIKGSDLIVVGRVARVVAVSGHRFADLDVETVLKGRAGSRVRFLAEPTWTCDSTSAKAGERGVFLLKRTDWEERGLMDDPGILDAVREASRREAIYGVDHSGSGKILFEPGVSAWKSGDGRYVVNMYFLPPGLRPGSQNADKGLFTEGKFAAAVRAMASGRTFEPSILSRKKR